MKLKTHGSALAVNNAGGFADRHFVKVVLGKQLSLCRRRNVERLLAKRRRIIRGCGSKDRSRCDIAWVEV
jgi:hypothetical protein